MLDVPDYRLETSRNGRAWTIASEGSLNPEETFFFNFVTPTSGTRAVRFVRLTLLGPQLIATCSEITEQSGCRFIDFRGWLHEVQIAASREPHWPQKANPSGDAKPHWAHRNVTTSGRSPHP